MAKDNTPNLFGIEEVEEVNIGSVIRVSFETGVDAEFDYNLPIELGTVDVGCRVEVPFGRKNKSVTGFCVTILDDEQAHASRSFKLKNVKKVVDAVPLIDAELMALARWISSYYVCPLGQVLMAMVPSAVKKAAGVKKQQYISKLETDVRSLRSQNTKLDAELDIAETAFNTAILKNVQMEQPTHCSLCRAALKAMEQS